METVKTGPAKDNEFENFPAWGSTHLNVLSCVWTKTLVYSGLLLQEKPKLVLANFMASKIWLEKFKRRQVPIFKAVCGETVNIKICDKRDSKRLGLFYGYEDIYIQSHTEWNTVVSEKGIRFAELVTCDNGKNRELMI